MTLYRKPAIATLAAFAAFLAGPSGCQTATEADPTVEVGIKPDYVPIEVFVNTQGELWVRFDGTFVTPIGTFTVNTAPDPKGHEDDLLVAFIHTRHGVDVYSYLWLEDLAKGDVGLTATGGSGVEVAQERTKATIEIPPGAQDFTLEPADYDDVRKPASTSVTQWTEPPSASPAPSTTPSGPSGTTAPPRSTSPTAPSEVTPTG